MTVVTSGDSQHLDRAFQIWRELIQDVEQSSIPTLAKDSLPLTIYLFSREDEWERFREHSGKSDRCAGFYEYPACRVFLSGASGRETLRHELVHHLHHSKAGFSTPPWLGEGLADYFEGEPDASRGFSSFFELIIGHDERPPKGTPQLLDWILSRSQSGIDNTIARIYAELLVRLLVTHPSLRPHFAEYVLRKASPRDRLAQLCAAFSIREEQLVSLYEGAVREEFKKYLSK